MWGWGRWVQVQGRPDPPGSGLGLLQRMSLCLNDEAFPEWRGPPPELVATGPAKDTHAHCPVGPWLRSHSLTPHPTLFLPSCSVSPKHLLFGTLLHPRLLCGPPLGPALAIPKAEAAAVPERSLLGFLPPRLSLLLFCTEDQSLLYQHPFFIASRGEKTRGVWPDFPMVESRTSPEGVVTTGWPPAPIQGFLQALPLLVASQLGGCRAKSTTPTERRGVRGPALAVGAPSAMFSRPGQDGPSALSLLVGAWWLYSAACSHTHFT